MKKTIVIEIPNEKADLFMATIQHHAGENLQPPEAIAWIKKRWIADLRNLVARYQLDEFNKDFTPDTEIGE